jgi:hypothetical protein
MMFGDEVIDTKDVFETLKIGHSSDSTTKSIQMCPLPDLDVVLADSCGFEDTEGCTVDIATVISPKNAMMRCSLFHPVVMVDVRSIDIGKGVTFSKLLQLVTRFFSLLKS